MLSPTSSNAQEVTSKAPAAAAVQDEATAAVKAPPPAASNLKEGKGKEKKPPPQEVEAKPKLSKAERRELQERQRAVKAAAKAEAGGGGGAGAGKALAKVSSIKKTDTKSTAKVLEKDGKGGGAVAAGALSAGSNQQEAGGGQAAVAGGNQLELFAHLQQYHKTKPAGTHLLPGSFAASPPPPPIPSHLGPAGCFPQLSALRPALYLPSSPAPSPTLLFLRNCDPDNTFSRPSPPCSLPVL